MTHLYVSPVAGHVVSRFGTASKAANNQQIGLTKDSITGDLSWDESLVVVIPAAEAARFPREYQRAFDDGALKQRTEADYKAWHHEHMAPQRAAVAAAKKAAEEEAAKKTAAEVAAPAPTVIEEELPEVLAEPASSAPAAEEPVDELPAQGA